MLIIAKTDAHTKAYSNKTNMRSSHVGMAHFAGTGPADKTCKDCAHRTAASGRMHFCEKTRQMTGKTVAIPAKPAACKYFQPKK